MADNWDDGSDDEWDVDDDVLDQKLGLQKGNAGPAAAFADEEDLAVLEKARADKASLVELKKKGNALLDKKAAERARVADEELVRRAMALEAAAAADLSPDERRAFQRRLVEDADHALTDDLFGGGGGGSATAVHDGSAATAAAAASSSTPGDNHPGTSLVLRDMMDHLKHARRVADGLRNHGQIHLATAFFREALTQSDAVLDDDAVTELIKTLNVMKNDKVAAAKRKVKGQAQKSKKVDKGVAAQARKIQVETFGDNDRYDDYDQIGAKYEDDFF